MASELGKHIHFLGIGGIGVSALAQLAQARGCAVSGSDLHADPQDNPALQRLIKRGAAIFQGHAAEHLCPETDLVVVSAAVPADNPEILAARERGVRVVSRADFLGELMAAHPGPKIAVAGTHGKTTATGMIGVLLQQAGLEPTVFVGGEIPQLGGNFCIGSETGPFVAEACEAYDSFLSLRPDIALITNIEADHLDHYGTYENVLAAFRQFLAQVPEKGTIILCMDDAGVRRMEQEPGIAAEIVHYGIEFGIDAPQGIHFAGRISLGNRPKFAVDYRHGDTKSVLNMRLQVPGRHNVLNALGAILVGATLNLSGEQLISGIGMFQGAVRRQEILAEVAGPRGSILVMDDYAHHPTEIRVTLEALRAAYPDRRQVVVFQPHLYSRTRDFLEEFADALSTAEALIITNIYPAREKPIPGVHAADIIQKATALNAEALRFYLPDKKDIPYTLMALAHPNDLILFMGAGDIREQGEAFAALLQARQQKEAGS